MQFRKAYRFPLEPKKAQLEQKWHPNRKAIGIDMEGAKNILAAGCIVLTCGDVKSVTAKAKEFYWF